MSKQPFSDLIEKFPKLFGIYGTKRRELERTADNLDVDRDWMPSDEGWDEPNQE